MAVGVFSFGLSLVHAQWFSSKSIVFSNTKNSMIKIQNLYELSINAAMKKDATSQKDYLMSAINLTENAIERSPLDPDLHFIKGKLYSFLDGNENKTKSSFRIQSSLDPTWVSLPLRQSQVWLFIDIEETRRLWIEALERSKILDDRFSKSTWDRILMQARQHPIQIRNVYEVIIDKDDPYYIIRWMDSVGINNLTAQMPKILQSTLLSGDTKKEITSHWKKISPKDYQKYLQTRSD